MKIKAKDLMIGDLIEVRVGVNGEWKVVRVDELRYMDNSDTMYILYKDMDGKRIGYISEDASDDIRGISITKLILLKNGFDGDCYYRLDGDDNKFYEFYLYEKRLTLYYVGIDEWENHAEVKDVLFRTQCNYVHQLQHAFKMWGDFVELADKIIV